ncbi:MAG: hypothetical protein WDA16_01335 [Candidatus Thermoplasmatota archaeon]
MAANATRSEAELRATIVAETVRVGLCRLLHESPLRRVHQNQLRNWVRRKLEGVIPDLFTDERGNYRDLLLDGRGGNLGFTGDVLTLPDGYLYPAPTRAIPIADNTYVLASGFPSTAFQDLRDRLVFTALARRIEGVTKPELQALGIRIQSIESYLASSGANESRDGILADVLKRPRQPWVGTASWQCYRGNNPSAYGFPFTEESRTARYGQHDVSLWWEPITLSYGHYWLRATRSRREDHAHQVSPREWKRVALALDVVSGGQREAIGTKGPLGVTLRLNFSPAENVYRWFQVSGVRWLGRRKAQDEWEIPLPALEPIRKLLDQAGVRIRVLGEGR